MSTKRCVTVAVATLAVVFGFTGSVMAQDELGAHLSGVQEVPPVFSRGHGFALVGVDYDLSTVKYAVLYFKLESHVTQAHIHFGTPGVNGAIMVFLCSNLPGKPAGVQACPNEPGLNSISGTLTAADVVPGAAAQGVNPGDFEAFSTALSSASAYVNVHTEGFPAGEIRGPLGD
jgi:hypothetical protein